MAASTTSTRPSRGSPKPATTLSASVAIVAPAWPTTGPSTPASGEAGAVPGGASVSFEDAPAPGGPPPARDGAPDAPPVSGRAPSPEARAAQEERPRPTGRQAAEAALRERALRAPAPGTRVGAADDDSASIDDEDISDSSVVGLAAVLEVLGGRVIEEKTTEGTY